MAGPIDYGCVLADPTVYVRETYGDVLRTGAFYLYGAGNVGRKMLAALRADGRNVRGFLDNNPSLCGGEIEGAKVWPFENLAPADNDVCVITIWNYHHDFAKSAEHARQLGFKTIMHFSALAVLGGYDGIFPNYAVDHPAVVFTPAFEADYAALNTALADAPSRTLARRVLDFYALPTPENLPPMSARQLPFDPSQISTYVDCGAFIGDDFAQHRAVFDQLTTVYLIEPDPGTFEALRNRDFPGLNSVIPLHAAASDSGGVVRFAASGTWGSKVAIDGATEETVEVQTLTLDSLPLGSDERAYVKMDVEGHELAVLAGAHALLSDPRTVFCITLEHKARDLFDVPRLLARYPHRRNYLFANDTEFAMDLVIYSVPS
jgi:FkbM family methyltransferase